MFPGSDKQKRTDWRESCDPAVLREAIAGLAHEVELAYFESRYDDCDQAHDDLVAAEWRLRQAERRG